MQSALFLMQWLLHLLSPQLRLQKSYLHWDFTNHAAICACIDISKIMHANSCDSSSNIWAMQWSYLCAQGWDSNPCHAFGHSWTIFLHEHRCSGHTCRKNHACTKQSIKQCITLSREWMYCLSSLLMLIIDGLYCMPDPMITWHFVFLAFWCCFMQCSLNKLNKLSKSSVRWTNWSADWSPIAFPAEVASEQWYANGSE